MRIDEYIGQLNGIPSGMALDGSLEALNAKNHLFDELPKSASKIGKDHLHGLEEFGSLVKIKSLSSEISSKKSITSRLAALNSAVEAIARKRLDSSSLKAALYSVFHDKESGANIIIDELNRFKSKLNELEKHHSKICNSLDSMASSHGHGLQKEHIGQLHSVHASQKKALKSIISNFISHSRNHVKRLKKV
jgi:hypothetical protein